MGARPRRSDALGPVWMEAQLAEIDAAAHRMLGVIGEVEDAARLRAGEALDLEREPVDVVALAQAVAAEVAPQRAVAAHQRTRREMDPEQTVVAGYDRIAEQYLRGKDAGDPVTLAALEELARGLPPNGAALDLGCGAGVPVTQWLARQFAVTGVDVSARQLQLAREHAPGATLVEASMTLVDFAPGSFDAVVAFYSIIHVPRAEQPALLRRIYRWLKPGGAFLATWATQEWEGEEENWEGWGAPMWWSHYDADTNLGMLRDAGFSVVSADTRTGNGETWLWVLART